MTCTAPAEPLLPLAHSALYHRCHKACMVAVWHTPSICCFCSFRCIACGLHHCRPPGKCWGLYDYVACALHKQALRKRQVWCSLSIHSN